MHEQLSSEGEALQKNITSWSSRELFGADNTGFDKARDWIGQNLHSCKNDIVQIREFLQTEDTYGVKNTRYRLPERKWRKLKG